MSNIKLFFAPGACSFVPHVGLEAARAATGQDFEAQPVKLHKGEQRTPDYLALNPDGQVPVLVVDGEPLTQIVAICDWIDRSFPAAGLLPTDAWARAKALSRLAWMNNSVHPSFTHVFMPQKFARDESAVADVRAFAVEQYRGHLERLDGMAQQASPWLAGERFSFLDAYALTLLRWAGFAEIDASEMPALQALVSRAAEHPPVAAVMAREGITLSVPRRA